MSWYFAFFLVSGFCGILYELIWMRLAMAQFGVTTALVSIVLSTFMAGLGAGSWASGALIRKYGERLKVAPLRLYSLAELLIGVSGLLVPVELAWGHGLLARMAQQVPISSGMYYVVAGGCLALTLVPWCSCMGATIPLAMFIIGRDSRYDARRSFSFLYLANVLGAAAGAIVPLFLIELYGFRGTLRAGAVSNVAIATSAFLLSLTTPSRNSGVHRQVAGAITARPFERNVPLLLLFTTGLATMGMELIWIRLFTPYVGPLVYSFAMILGTYLLATFGGSRVYRFWSRGHDREGGLLWFSLALLGLLPLITADVRVPLLPSLRILLGIAPFSAVIGFLTPMLVDRWSGGDPNRAGRAYAVNVVGCIVGPLVSGFILLPFVGEHVSMLLLLLALLWLAIAVRPTDLKNKKFQLAKAYAVVAASLAVFFLTKDYETQFPQRRVLRDNTATVIATGTGMQKRLFVNGVGMTSLTPITKMMAHFSLASLDHSPRSVLVICFGMGTTFRSALSWGIPVTVVDLVPSVPKLFDYYFPDAPKVLSSPLAHVEIDDGRRYLERTEKRYDAIIIDPPPPVPAVGSSLLYSREFYGLIQQHLEPGGIVAQWLPDADNAVRSSVSQALRDSFAYVRVFDSVEHWGWQFLGSSRPIPLGTGKELLARMPPRAVTDMMEWGPSATPLRELDSMLSQERNLDQLISLSPLTPALSDDRPINEYNLLRSRCYRCPSAATISGRFSIPGF